MVAFRWKRKGICVILFSFFTLCGGLAFFLYGMTVLSTSLERLAGHRLERVLRHMTSGPGRSLLLGTCITIALQSSSAMTVMLVSLVNSGVMKLGQTIGVIMGSNIGTTLTPWILALTGIESENFFLTLLNPQNLSSPLALIGVFLVMLSSVARRRSIGHILVGFSLLMCGMEIMSQAVEPLTVLPQFSQLLITFQNPLWGVLVGTVFTGLIQSSTASIGILQTLATTDSITYAMAIPIILGQNIGTCVTALLSSIGTSSNAKKVAWLHILFNLFGTILCMVLLFGSDLLLRFHFMNLPVDAGGIAFCHTIFNLITTLLLLPFSRQLEQLAVDPKRLFSNHRHRLRPTLR